MTRYFRPLTILLVSLAMFFVQNASAQSSKGSVYGHVTDSSGSVLPGAEIELQPGTIVAKTGEHGTYFIYDVTPGQYTITITYV